MVSVTKKRALDHETLRKRDREMIPTLLLRAMFVMVICTLIIVGYARLTDRPLVAAPPVDTPVLAERAIILHGSMSGAARVLDTDGRVLADFGGDEGGFIAGVWRVLQRERAKHKVDLDLPINLVLFEDNRLGLRDDFTGWRAELIGFGIDNYRIFLNLLAEPQAAASTN